MPKVMLLAFLGLAVFLNSSCSPPVNIKDEIITTSLGINGGQDVDMFTSNKTIVDYQTIIARWNNLDNIQVMMPITAIEDIENELATLCTDYAGSCTETQTSAINGLISKFQMLKDSAESNHKSY